MRGFSRKLIVVGIAASVMTALAAPAFAFARIVVPSTLNDAQRARALTAPLGDTDPFGQPSESGGQWSRLQVPTSQGLQWIDVELRLPKKLIAASSTEKTTIPAKLRRAAFP